MGKPLRSFGSSDRLIEVDVNTFARNKCRLPGSVTFDVSRYPEHHRGKQSFGYLIQRRSDRNYAMRALCLDDHGAEYNTFKMTRVVMPSIVWFPPTNLNDHSNDLTVIDGVHLNLIRPIDGQTLLTGRAIVDAVSATGKPTECLFLNGASNSNSGGAISANDVALAISKCSGSLLCVSLTECDTNINLVDALASCSKLRGLIIDECEFWGEDEQADTALAAVLRSCPDLRWCLVQSKSMFGTSCWEALALDGSCPKLEVLWIDDAGARVKAGSDVIRKALAGRADMLKLCKIRPDKKYVSQY